MQTKIILSDPIKNLEIKKKQLQKRYKNIEYLFQELQRNQCNNPTPVDDYMLWHNILAYEKDLEEKGSDNKLPSNPPITFHEEIIINTTDFYENPTPRRMELLDYIIKHEPASVKELAEETKRDYKNIYDDVKALERANLIEFLYEGKNKRPVSRVTRIEIVMK